MPKRIYVGVNASRGLPNGYTELTYIESSGTQYINSGFIPNNNTKTICDAELISGTNDISVPFGTYESGSNRFALMYHHQLGWTHWVGGASGQCAGEQLGRHTFTLTGTSLIVDSATKTFTTSAFTGSVPMFIFGINYTGHLDYATSMRLYSCKIYDNGALVRDFVPCMNSSAIAGLYDMVNNKFYANAGTGSFTTGSFVPTSGVARKISKIYIGVNNIARKVTKGYVGINGVARQFFPSLEGVGYVGLITPLSVPRYLFQALTTPDGNHIIFAGGAGNDRNAVNTVDAYDKSFTRTLPTALSETTCQLGAARVGNYVLFGGGATIVSGTTMRSTVNAYDNSLTRSLPTAMTNKRSQCGSGSVGDYAIFLGGRIQGGADNETMEAYNSSLTKTVKTTEKDGGGLYAIGSCSLDNYAIFGGGRIGTSDSNRAIAINSSLTKSTLSELSLSAYNTSGARVGDYALFAGGSRGSGTSGSLRKAVTAYDSSLTRSFPTDLSAPRYNMTGISSPKFALFGGGAESTKGGSTAVNGTFDAYDQNLTRSNPVNLSVPRYNMAGDLINGYAFYGGGTSINVTEGNGSAFDEVEVYEVPLE